MQESYNRISVIKNINVQPITIIHSPYEYYRRQKWIQEWRGNPPPPKLRKKSEKISFFTRFLDLIRAEKCSIFWKFLNSPPLPKTGNLGKFLGRYTNKKKLNNFKIFEFPLPSQNEKLRNFWVHEQKIKTQVQKILEFSPSPMVLWIHHYMKNKLIIRIAINKLYVYYQEKI